MRLDHTQRHVKTGTVAIIGIQQAQHVSGNFLPIFREIDCIFYSLLFSAHKLFPGCGPECRGADSGPPPGNNVGAENHKL
jgi:hypothetical protein